MNFSKEILMMSHPFTAIVSGPTSSGKTVWVQRLLSDYKNQIKNIPKNIKCVWCYGQWQKTYSKTLPGCDIKYVDGLIDENEIKNNKPDIIIIDDLMNEVGDSKSLANLFTKGSHHLNISVIFILQNIFHQGKMMRTISLNTHYFFLMKNVRDKSQIMSLGRQLYPYNLKHFLEAFQDATSEPYSYIRIDTTPNTPEKLRLFTRLFKEELPENHRYSFSPIVYQPKNVWKFKKYFVPLKLLSQIKNKDIRKNATCDFCKNENLYKAIKEIALNIVNKNIPLTNKDKKKLKKYKKDIYLLSKQKFKSKRKQKVLQQTGGFLPILIPLVATILGQIYENNKTKWKN